MSIHKIGKTTVSPNIAGGIYRGAFGVSNEYLNTHWHMIDDEIWSRISSQICLIVENEVIKEMKNKMNEEAYNEEFGDSQ